MVMAVLMAVVVVLSDILRTHLHYMIMMIIVFVVVLRLIVLTLLKIMIHDNANAHGYALFSLVTQPFLVVLFAAVDSVATSLIYRLLYTPFASKRIICSL